MQDFSLLLTSLFAFLVVAVLMVRVWLSTRQVRWVAQHRAEVPVAFADQVDLAAHQKAADYTLAKSRLGLLELAIQTALLLGWTLLGGLDALNRGLLSVMVPGMGQQLALLASFAVVGGLLDLPLSWYRAFRLEQHFGFNRMSQRDWVLDGVKGAAVGAVVGLPIAALVLWLMASAGPTWWLWAWGAFMGFNLLMLVLYPTLIAPLFNRFEPLADEALVARVTRLMQRCGFRARGLLVMDGSRRSAHANAYFTGFGSSKRVVLFDTLLSQLEAPEVEAVLAHELGHYHHRHIPKRIAVVALSSLLSFAALGWLSAQVWFFTGLGVEPHLAAPNDALALLLFTMTTPLLGFFLSPLMAASSRRHEFEADAYASQHANATDLAHALVKLHRDNASTLTPDPLFVRFYYSHPPATERLARLLA